MAIITLTKGFVTYIDDDLYEELNQHKWHAAGIEGRPARRRISDRKIIFIYHQILNVLPWELRQQGLCVDHINNDPLDNRRLNLRVVSVSENNRNKFKGRAGIGFDGTHNKYKAYLDRDGYKRLNIGTFKHRIDAERALYQTKKELDLEDNKDS